MAWVDQLGPGLRPGGPLDVDGGEVPAPCDEDQGEEPERLLDPALPKAGRLEEEGPVPRPRLARLPAVQDGGEAEDRPPRISENEASVALPPQRAVLGRHRVLLEERGPGDGRISVERGELDLRKRLERIPDRGLDAGHRVDPEARDPPVRPVRGVQQLLEPHGLGQQARVELAAIWRRHDHRSDRRAQRGDRWIDLQGHRDSRVAGAQRGHPLGSTEDPLKVEAQPTLAEQVEPVRRALDPGLLSLDRPELRLGAPQDLGELFVGERPREELHQAGKIDRGLRHATPPDRSAARGRPRTGHGCPRRRARSWRAG